MLNRLLDLLQEGSTRRIVDLADELGTTSQLVEAMLDDLERMGYVRRLVTDCSEACSACPMSGACAAGGSQTGGNDGRMWVLTDKTR